MSDPASWLPFIGALVTALAAAAVALIIDARRRADAERVRLDAGRVAAYAAVLEAGLSARHLIRREQERSQQNPRISGGAIDRFSIAIFSAQILATPDTMSALQALRVTVLSRYRAVKRARDAGDFQALGDALDGFSEEYGRARDRFAEAANAELTQVGRTTAWTVSFRDLRKEE